ncbi:hypothetical protein ROHU_022456 [Labeo rohita]|uniref:Uncharacterized protein n=1 Tax=Labeo rohita TaxID=84645 RepID=A0A498MTP5_LABRO|nr:hypothetical protein ROHU_022456 [Labeo rohita]
MRSRQGSWYDQENTENLNCYAVLTWRSFLTGKSDIFFQSRCGADGKVDFFQGKCQKPELLCSAEVEVAFNRETLEML